MAVGSQLVNTGRKEKKQIDANPNSLTFGQVRWVDAGDDFVLCPLPAVPIYANLEIERIVFRNNCGVGFVGGSVIYKVPAAMFTSYDSQAAANQLAEDYFAANSQAYANASGVCIPDESQDSGGGSV